MISYQGLGGPVVRVRVVAFWSQRGSGPRRPTKEGCQLPDLLWIGDRRGPEAVSGVWRGEEFAVVFDKLVKGLALRR